ncbi:YopX family protein [Alistipes indistinctus]|uniref:YopX family protein n=1 Tax=Alistipes indistinctus TaxID=626932 RepID=UPI003F10808A
MRPIKFRGIEIKSKRWVYGAYVPAIDEDCCDSIIDEQGALHIVFSETVGQYTGLKDKNGKEIWEGDIVQCKTWQHYVATIIYDDSWGAFSLRFYPFGSGRRVRVTHKSVKVIGNTIDNPELLK